MSLEHTMRLKLAEQIMKLPCTIKEEILKVSIEELKEQIYEEIVEKMKVDLCDLVISKLENNDDEEYTFREKDELDDIAKEISDTVRERFDTIMMSLPRKLNRYRVLRHW